MPALKQQPAKKTAGGERVQPPAKRKPLDIESACKDVMKRYPKVLARLAE